MAAISGQKTVTTAGTAVALGAGRVDGPLSVKALDTNTGVVALGNDGANDITVSNGLRLAPGEVIIFEYLGDLASIFLDSAINGEGVSWLALNG